MKITTFQAESFGSTKLLAFSGIDNYQNLSSCIGTPPRILSYVRKFKEEKKMQTLVVVKDRKTYKSSKQLSAIQHAIKDNLAQKIFNSLKDSDHILAYKKGFDYRKELQDCVDNSLQISFDIKKCYDSITFKHIVNMLKHYGFTHRGAKLVAGYCVVGRKLPSGKILNTLQQGSQCSPIISNLVLNMILDEPIKLWIKNNIEKNALNIEYKYYRYSDNVVLFLTGSSIPLDFLKEYRAMYRHLLNTQNIFVHDEYTTPNNHPFRNQRFLGIVLNKVARIELKEFSKIRAILFNCCRNGVLIEARRYLSERIYDFTCNPEIPFSDEDIIAKFSSILKGKVSYIKNISGRQYLQLRKLILASDILKNIKEVYIDGNLREDLFSFIKIGYRDHFLSEEDFLKKLKFMVSKG